MKTIDPTLLTAQKTVAGSVIAHASLADSGRLHLTQLHDSGAGANNTVKAVLAGSVIVRIRQVAASGDLEYQRITDPATAAQWANWTSFGLTNVSAKIAIFYDGSYIVAAWRNSATGAIRYSRSGDGGQTWSVAADAYTGFTTTNDMCGVSGGASNSGLFVGGITATDRDLFWCKYTSATDTWSAASGAGLALNLIYSVAAAYDTDNARHIVLAEINNHVTWAHQSIVAYVRSGAGAWSSGAVIYGVAASVVSFSNLTLSQKESGFYYLTLYITRPTSAGWHLTRFDDDLCLEDLLLINARARYDLTSIGTLASAFYVANGEQVFRSTSVIYWSNKLTRHYKLDLRSDGGGHLVADVDNRNGALTEPALFSTLALERGLNVNSADYYVSAGAFFVVGWHYVDLDNFLRVEAVDSLGLMRLWEADQSWRWDGVRLDQLVRHVTALAGVHNVTFDAAAVWADTADIFIVQINQDALSALKALAIRGGFDVVAQEDGGLRCFVPTAAPASQYTYNHDAASGQHVHWPGVFGRGAAPNYIAVYGDTVNDIAEVWDDAHQWPAGRRVSNAINQRAITTVADAEELRNARLVLAKELRRAGVFEAPPNFALEPGDVIDFDSGRWYEINGPWRVTGFLEEFNGPRERKFLQRLELRGTA